MSIWSVALVGAHELEAALVRLSAIDGPRVAVVLEAEQSWWEPAIALAEARVVQPFDRGSGVALLAALARIPRDDLLARVVVLRSTDERSIAAIRAELPRLAPDAIVRVGDSIVATAGALLDLYHEAQPALLRAFLEHQGAALDQLYPWLSSIDLDRDLLAFAGERITRAA